MTTVLWLRRDLRVHDHPALVAAHEAGGPVVPLFVADPTLVASAGAPRLAALHQALAALREATGGALVVRAGRPDDVVPALVREVGATSVHVSAETTPYGRRRDARAERVLADLEVPLVATGSPYAVTPGRVLGTSGRPYQVFGPFARAWRDHGWRRPAEVPAGLRWRTGVAGDGVLPGEAAAASMARGPEGATSAAGDTGASPAPVLAAALQGRSAARASGPALTEVTEDAAHRLWEEFCDDGLERYAADRDRPDLAATSGLSVHLKYGTIHPRTILADIAAHPAGRGAGAASFVTELAWREFYADVLWHHPASAWTDLRPALHGMRYDDPDRDPRAAERLAAWQAGRTGYPFVDAGMRQLLAEGFVHNRVRMVVASFLVKDLHVWWVHGARWFMAHLRDGDVASNSHGWQWVAGTGTDAAPYFRVFNPVAQGRRFDPDGAYVRRYVPELAHVGGAAVHEPWAAPDGYAGGYPARLVDHAAEREEALARYAAARG